MRYFTLMAALGLSACMSTSDIVPAGKDSYMVTVSMSGPGAGQGRVNAVKSANAYCATISKHMIIRRYDTSGAGVTVNPLVTTLIFSCVGDSDPEWARPNLHTDPTTVIHDQR